MELVRTSPAVPATLGTADQLAAAWLLGYPKTTARAYRSDLADWGRFLEALQLEPLQAQRGHVDAYARTMEAQGRAKGTVARRLSALAGFYAYATDEGLIDRSPVARVRRPKVGNDSQQLGLDRDELRELLRAAEAKPRDRALLALLAFNGLRISEALGSDVTDLGYQRGHRTLTIHRKGGAGALVPLAPRTAEAIDAYLAGREAGPLFATSSGARLDRFAAGKIVRRLARQAAITKAISPHSLRHSFVTAALDAGVSLRDVQDAAGHADPRTTRRYDRARYSLDRHPTYTVAATI